MPKNKNAIFEISSVEVGTANDPYLDEVFVFRRQHVKIYSLMPFRKSTFYIENS